MGCGARYALIVTVAAALARSLAAQNPTPASPQPGARDTTARYTTARDTSGVAHLIYSEVLTGGTAIAPRVALTRGVVYRVELEPAGAVLEIRSARRPSLPPLFLVPLAPEEFSSSYLVVPNSTEDYRFDVGATTDAPVRLRIWLDPKESARYGRIRAGGFRLPVLALRAGMMYLPPFRDVLSSPADSVYGLSTKPQAAYGVKACLAVVPNGRILPDRTGGCAVAFALWHRASGRDFYSIGVEPEVVIRRRQEWQLSLTPQLDFGSTRGGNPSAQYVFWGLGARFTAEIAHSPRLGFQGEATVLEIDTQPGSGTPTRVHTVDVALGAGLIVKL